MRKNNVDFDEYLDDENYYSEESDSSIVDDVDEDDKKYDEIENNYEEFNKVIEEVDEEEPEVEYVAKKTTINTHAANNYRIQNGKKIIEDEEEEYESFSILSFISDWIGKIGIVIAIILIAYFIVTGQFKNLLLYLIGLVVAYFFGYFFMFLLYRFEEK